MTALIDHFAVGRAATIEFIRELVARESNSRDEASLNELARFVADHLRPLGGEIDLLPQPGYGSHLRARFNFGYQAGTPHLLVIGHLDTVWPCGTLARLPFRLTEDGRAYGPGIFDMKAGVAVAVEALRAIHKYSIAAKHPITLLLTCDEEIGSTTSRALVEFEARSSVAALVLEPPIPGGIVKTSRKGVGRFTIRALGRAAHAGLDPSRGVNAIVELAHQLLHLNALNDHERGATVNVGVIRGGTTSNVVPAEAQATIDVRFWTPEEGSQIDNFIRQLSPVLSGAQLEIGGGLNRPPMRRSPGNMAVFERARLFAAELGFNLQEGSVGGGSDGNFTAALGIPTLDGLGVDGAGAHADHEHIILSDLPRRAALLTKLMTELTL